MDDERCEGAAVAPPPAAGTVRGAVAPPMPGTVRGPGTRAWAVSRAGIAEPAGPLPPFHAPDGGDDSPAPTAHRGVTAREPDRVTPG